MIRRVNAERLSKISQKSLVTQIGDSGCSFDNKSADLVVSPVLSGMSWWQPPGDDGRRAHGPYSMRSLMMDIRSSSHWTATGDTFEATQ